MTIRKQFTLLISVIIMIPLVFILFIMCHNYLRSPRRMLIKENKGIHIFNSVNLSEEELLVTKDIISNMPSDLEFTLFTNELEILFSKIPDFEIEKHYKVEDFYELFDITSNLYIYQLSKRKLPEKDIYILTRINKKDNIIKKIYKNLPLSLFVFLLFIVCFCSILVIYISQTIFKSIIKIEEQTSAIAEGDLSVKIKTNDDEVKENEITSLSSSLEKMRISLLEAQNQKNKFIMGLSHDLRTPVSIIKGYTEALQDNIITDPNEITKTLDLILTKSTQLENMIETLINFMKLNNKELRNKLQPASISKTIKDFAKDAEITGQVFKRLIKTNINLPEEDIFVPMDKQLVSRAFENIFSNALRYTNDNDIIELSAHKNNDELLFCVKDSGVGIEKEDLANIFNLFYRGTNSRLEEGMGIGLSVVKNIVDTHGWNISVDSEINKGTCFTISIPLTQAN